MEKLKKFHTKAVNEKLLDNLEEGIKNAVKSSPNQKLQCADTVTTVIHSHTKLARLVTRPAKDIVWVVGIAAGVAIVHAWRQKSIRAHNCAQEIKEAEMLLHIKSMWAGSKTAIEATENHPYLMSMLEGSLSIRSFCYYIQQNSLFLKHFAVALRLAALKAPSAVDSSTLRSLAAGANSAELGLHENFLRQWAEPDEVPGNRKRDAKTLDDSDMSPTTSHYTSFVLAVATTGTYEEALSALLPCFVIYDHLGAKLLTWRRALDDAAFSLPQAPPLPSSILKLRGTKQARPALFDKWIDM